MGSDRRPEVTIASGSARLEAFWSLPKDARGAIIFAHGSGSGRFSPRNQFVAQALLDAGFATLLGDLLTQEEEAADRRTGGFRFDVELLARRLEDAVQWVRGNPESAALPIGLFGASTGAAAALIAAAHEPKAVSAIVSRGGRPDMAGAALQSVVAPTLLIVGGNDSAVLELNREAASQLRAANETMIVAGATHLFEEPGALEQVADLARAWFERYLARAGRPG